MSESLPPLPPELESLFVAERTHVDGDVASRERHQRVRNRLESSVVALSVAASLGTAVTLATKTAGAAGLLSAGVRLGKRLLGVKAALVAVTVASAGAGGIVGFEVGKRTQVPKSVLPIVKAVPVVASESVIPAPPVSSALTPPEVRSAKPVRETRDDDDAKLAEEIALVQMARTALLRGDATLALEGTEKHRRKFAKGRLAEERESVAIQALARLGRLDEARARLRLFEQRYPNSVALPAVRRDVEAL
jgi:hypothetical protein